MCCFRGGKEAKQISRRFIDYKWKQSMHRKYTKDLQKYLMSIIPTTPLSYMFILSKAFYILLSIYHIRRNLFYLCL